MTAPPVRYQNLFMDNARWEGVELREGDIVISTPAKCGTTWTQIICGLLVFGRPELPAPLDDLTVWVDALFRPHAEMLAHLEAQDHRRFIKSHTPLDGLPQDDRVTYISIGRDPRDVGVSIDNHLLNMDMEKAMRLRAAALGPDAGALPAMAPPAPTPYERFWDWVDAEDNLIGLGAMLRHLEGFWERRDEPNIVLLHFDDLKTDLDGQMRALAAALGTTVDEAVWPDLVRAATFAEVRGRAATLAPENTLWRDRAMFFNKGASGQWKELLDDADLERYRARIAALTTPEIAAWLHRDGL
ncbi:sulfotransferase domain-containing protein [Glycomyces terrestris]|uniref:Sulfotransferase domain-containing protein n=1 Tax=Glycomyces terrestris TaxID=2493553 RepID=A0A426V386_9ACTN|nr:sulfotransferase domain-containing protein [Glycomyces terrestris]RRS01326.1 sulfotransferase domain-containing protein [Glycomyces terrestris]